MIVNKTGRRMETIKATMSKKMTLAPTEGLVCHPYLEVPESMDKASPGGESLQTLAGPEAL
jgi:hypothetical protein